MEPRQILTVVCQSKGCSRGWWSHSTTLPEVCPRCEGALTERERVTSVPLMEGPLSS